MVYSSANDDGKRKYLSSFKTLTEAKKFLEKYNSEKHLDYISVETVYNRWKANHFLTITPSSQQSYLTAWKYVSKIKDIDIHEIKTSHFQIIIDEVKLKYSRALCEKIKNLCSQLCQFAMQEDYLDKNYALFLVLPKAIKTQKTIFTDEQISILFNNDEDETVKIILILIFTGLRISELFEVKKENVFIDKKYFIGGKKTEAGTDRIVPIISVISGYMKYFYDKSNDEFLIKKNPKNFRARNYYPKIIELGFVTEQEKGTMSPHSCKHTLASMSAKANIKPEYLKEILGHSKYSTTIDYYVHNDTTQLITAINEIWKDSEEED